VASKEEEKRSAWYRKKHHPKHDYQGVTVGYKFKMVLAYSHFPIVVNVLDGGKALEIKNFLGFKINKRIDAPEGVLITRKEEEKEQPHFTRHRPGKSISMLCSYPPIYRHPRQGLAFFPRRYLRPRRQTRIQRLIKIFKDLYEFYLFIN
jgi:hypothetical protein